MLRDAPSDETECNNSWLLISFTLCHICLYIIYHKSNVCKVTKQSQVKCLLITGFLAWARFSCAVRMKR